ncbi:MAG: hypothetical protein ACYSTL_05575 [Planctomycetota bacterium]
MATHYKRLAEKLEKLEAECREKFLVIFEVLADFAKDDEPVREKGPIGFHTEMERE